MQARSQNIMSDDSLKSYYDNVKRIQLLSAEEERELSMRIRQATTAPVHGS
jgi:DNA-directed RNA polymerase sigma subunit (sigma70/sigma32)